LRGILVDITERKRSEKALQHRFEMERLISAISTNFINFSSANVDTRIDFALEHMGRFSGVDRSYLFRFSEDGKTMTNTHEWCAEGIEPQIENLQDLLVEEFEWSMKQLKRFENIQIPRVSNLPFEATAERQILQSQDIQSLVLVPCAYERTLLGFVGFDSVQTEKLWPEEDIALLKMVGDIIANALKHKFADKALQEREANLRTLFNSLHDFLWVLDLDGSIIVVNPAVLKRLGYLEEELLGKTVFDVHSPDRHEETATIVANVVAGRTHSCSLPVVAKDGTHIPVETKVSMGRWGNQDVLFGVSRDITERVQAEKALRSSERKYRVLAENVADGVAIVQKGRLKYANNALCSMLGFAAEQLDNMAAEDLFYDDYRKAFRQTLALCEKGMSDKYLQARCITGDGQELWTEGCHNFIEWDGKAAALLTVRDITEAKLRETAMEEEREYLRRENIKLKSTFKDRFRFDGIVGKSHAMQEVYELILRASVSDANAVIYGESGTGKELIARTIHSMSDRTDGVFVPVNCGAIPETLFESEFFGHRKGAFTGAHADRGGVL
jgi:PAS domain S-box-containing protein